MHELARLAADEAAVVIVAQHLGVSVKGEVSLLAGHQLGRTDWVEDILRRERKAHALLTAALTRYETMRAVVLTEL